MKRKPNTVSNVENQKTNGFSTPQERISVEEFRPAGELHLTSFRHFLARGRGVLIVDGQRYEVLTFSAMSLRIQSRTEFPQSCYQNAKFYLDGHEIANIDLNKVRTEGNSSGEFHTVFSLSRGSLSVIPRSWTVRQARFDASDEPFTLRIKTTTYSVINYSAFGVVIRSEGNSSIPEKAEGIVFAINGIEIATLDLRKVYEETEANGSQRVAFEITNGPLPLIRIDAILATRKIKDNLNQGMKRFEKVPVPFRSAVFELKILLDSMEERVNEIQNKKNLESSKELDQFENAFTEDIARYLHSVFDATAKLFEEIVRSLPESDQQECFKYFRERLTKHLYQSPFAHRSYYKPRGYAGDAEMMKMLYRNESLGKSLFAKCLHRYYMTHPNASAVRNRKNYLCKKILEFVSRPPVPSYTKVLSVACGPAEEVVQFISSYPQYLPRMSFHLLDQDVDSLGDAQLRLKTTYMQYQSDLVVTYIHKAIRNLITESQSAQYNLIYSAGLFDYFKDHIASKAAKRLYDMLLPGGQLIIGNFNGGSQVRAVMDLALDWGLIYRSQEDLSTLFRPICPELTIEQESQGINLFAVFTKDGNEF